ncbi:hypothetical protein C3L33_08955, partial [Rhododendron williamsianum]
METGESILDAIFDEDSLEDVQEVEMMDVEEGELVEQDSQTDLGQNIGRDRCAEKQVSCETIGVHAVEKQESCSKSRRRRNNKKKKNKGKKGSSGQKVTDINRFVLDICRRLQEKKTYLVYTAVGCLGVSALDDLVKEVAAIQACGGQKTADGRRFRNGGGILWNVLKSRDPDTFSEIMKKGKEFEKQFRQQSIKRGPLQNKEASPEKMDGTSTNLISLNASDVQNQLEQSDAEGKRVSVHDRIRLPVTYDDLLGGEDPKVESL